MENRNKLCLPNSKRYKTLAVPCISPYFLSQTHLGRQDTDVVRSANLSRPDFVPDVRE